MEQKMTDRRHATLAQDTPEAMLKMVLDREAATAARHDDRIKELKAQHQEAFQKYVEENEARIDAEAKLAKAVEVLTLWSDKYILALITPDPQAALDRVVAAERERCAKVAESRWRSWGQNDPHGPVECDVTACENIAAAIRKGGE
jgi:fumarylacetoacetate (FAA) hydrolase family protein